MTQTPEPTLETIAERLERSDRIGIALLGVIDDDGRFIETSANLPGWEGYPVVNELEARTGASVSLLNDTLAGALGAARDEEGRFLYVVWGTGVGAVLVEQNPLRAAQIELGHHSIEPEGASCPCGQRGCVSRLIGGGFARDEYGVSLDGADASVLETVTDRAARAFMNAAVLFDERRLVAHGGVVQNNDRLYERTRAKLRNRDSLVAPVAFERTTVRRPGVIGAARAAASGTDIQPPTL